MTITERTVTGLIAVILTTFTMYCIFYCSDASASGYKHQHETNVYITQEPDVYNVTEVYTTETVDITEYTEQATVLNQQINTYRNQLDNMIDDSNAMIASAGQLHFDWSTNDLQWGLALGNSGSRNAGSAGLAKRVGNLLLTGGYNHAVESGEDSIGIGINGRLKL